MWSKKINGEVAQEDKWRSGQQNHHRLDDDGDDYEKYNDNNCLFWFLQKEEHMSHAVDQPDRDTDPHKGQLCLSSSLFSIIKREREGSTYYNYIPIGHVQIKPVRKLNINKIFGVLMD